LIDYRQTWGDHQVYFHDNNQRLRAIPRDWTSMAAADPFVSMAAGRSCFRIVDLLELAKMIAREKEWSVKGIMPQV
jgi:hypothetical protein